MEEKQIPRDEFSSVRRSLVDNPGAFGVRSATYLTDFFGNLETWNVEVFRTDGKETAFVQRSSAGASLRLMLPPAIMELLVYHHDKLIGKVRGRAARKALETRKLRGDKIGNPEALKAHRKAQKSRKR